jgi:hypothetical protein
MLAASENGPRGTSVNVSMSPITSRPTDISAGPDANLTTAQQRRTFLESDSRSAPVMTADPALRLVPVRFRHALVTGDVNPRVAILLASPNLKAWMSQPCTKNDMNAASTPYCLVRV